MEWGDAMRRSFIYLEFKYPEQNWQEYDRTVVPAWAKHQDERMRREHPNADHRTRKAAK